VMLTIEDPLVALVPHQQMRTRVGPRQSVCVR
jgi:hypothetical protein